ncbi:MAG TPA: efflux RND transporter periplasmic adaptor subunit [Terrimicrobiaceae bacterium]
MASPPPTVSVAPPTVKEIVEWDEYIGRLESPETVEVRARVSGYLDKVYFKEGKEVKKGDLLITIDRRPYQAEYDRAEADYERLVNQAALAKNDADRAIKLMANKVIAEADYDSKAKSYSASLAAARSAKAVAELAKLNLEFTEIRSPIDGRVGRAFITEGNLVSNGSGGAGASLLTTVVSLDPLYLYGDVDERAILKYIRLSQEGLRDSARNKQIPVEMELTDEVNFPRKGLVDFLDNRVDPTTGTMSARGVFPNKDHSLSPGFFARLRVPGSARHQAILVPDHAIAADQSQKYVFVVNAGKKVEFRPITVGGMSDGLRIVTSGLKPNENVIIEGQIRVRPGIVVDQQPEEKAP